MGRPFFNYSIVQLEAAYESNRNDQNFLKGLLEELEHRTTARADKLAKDVLTSIDYLDSSAEKTKDSFELQPEAPKVKTEPVEINDFILDVDLEIPKFETQQRPVIANKPEDVLSSWIALEVFSPQTFKRPEDLAGGDRRLIVPLIGNQLPWVGEVEKSRPKYQLFYHVILGTIDMQKAIAGLLPIYSDERIERPPATGEAIIASLVLDQKGRLVEEGCIGISSFAWGLNHAFQGNLASLGDWPKVEKVVTEQLMKALLPYNQQNENSSAITLDALNKTLNALVKAFKIPPEFLKSNPFALRAYEYYKNDSPEPLLLNSFFVSDLAEARKLFLEKKAPPILKKYLRVETPTSRINLLDDTAKLEESVAPRMAPLARWPGAGRHPLVLLQQAAVNLAFNTLKKDSGILAVNGPPGTGKTTLLRDIVAGLVSDRAEEMCKFDDPATAFTFSGQKLKAGTAWLHLYNLDSSLKGFEMVIASSNNKAVENVSAELPGINSIAADAVDLRYFKSLSDNLLERDSWGLIAAVLGNAGNRFRFKQAFWWDEDTGLARYLGEANGTPQLIDVIDPETGKVTGTRKPRIVIEENAPSSHVQAISNWNSARNEFQIAVEESKASIEQINSIREAVLALPKLVKAEREAKEALDVAVVSETEVLKELNKLLEVRDVLDRKLKATEAVGKELLQRRPSFFSRLFNSKKYQDWKEEYDTHLLVLKLARKEFNGIKSQVHTSEEKYKNRQESRGRLAQNYQKTYQLFKARNTTVEQARLRLKSHLIDTGFFAQERQQIHITSPWFDNSIQSLRDNVFIKAIKLHKAFIAAAAKPLRNNLNVFTQLLGGLRFDEKEKLSLLPDLWSSLFLVVPSVSTTFASVRRMMEDLPPGSLGWSLIDEAGQALPQAAVGLLMRTKRAIVVGDPIQIEPVVTLPDTMTKRICKHFGADPDKYNAPEASVQTLADSVTQYFAEFETNGGSRAVGVPLLVHRRCDEPMFSISNAVAYSNLMVPAKQRAQSKIRDLLGPSRWIDVQGQAVDKWCPEEGEIVIDVLKRLKAASIYPNIYIITPFVIVADNLRRLLIDSRILDSWVDEPFKWPYERIGTVHTVQGREAEAVVFVLGAQMTQQNGARAWAGGRPNLLNVAVTRAKEVVYVVGNKELWKGAGLFKDLSRRL
ncbi:hypothetical protein GS399_11095 [Pedobacter sp. HMF7647]|uniref:DNA2/NAM7 helicase-like C-terminal domain-containing protein n=1 Tax=Hufsiella arboris TaxID=2695275 RepID=A0A7K1YAA2_9SPHI|nr:DEAD/DEAH box helicase [Hufsiella arboris]MXV51517.1 hypothetical protein [Hufsiella arboris]